MGFLWKTYISATVSHKRSVKFTTMFVCFFSPPPSFVLFLLLLCMQTFPAASTHLPQSFVLFFVFEGAEGLGASFHWGLHHFLRRLCHRLKDIIIIRVFIVQPQTCSKRKTTHTQVYSELNETTQKHRGVVGTKRNRTENKQQTQYQRTAYRTRALCSRFDKMLIHSRALMSHQLQSHLSKFPNRFLWLGNGQTVKAWWPFTWPVMVSIWPVSVNHFYKLTDVTQVWKLSSEITGSGLDSGSQLCLQICLLLSVFLL